MTKKSTEKLVSNLLEIQREVVEIFDSMTEDECVENFDLEDFLYSIEDRIKELKKIKNFKIVEL
jgi:diketogulonate reductase-like aldo/keto reductase